MGQNVEYETSCAVLWKRIALYVFDLFSGFVFISVLDYVRLGFVFLGFMLILLALVLFDTVHLGMVHLALLVSGFDCFRYIGHSFSFLVNIGLTVGCPTLFL